VHSEYIKQNAYFKNSEDAAKLLDYLLDHYPNFDNSELENSEIVYQKVFSKKPYTKENYRHLLSSLLKIVEHFLVQRNLEQDKFRQDKIMVKLYQEHNPEEYRKASKSLLKRLDQSSHISTKKFFDHYEILSNFYSHIATEQKKGVSLLIKLKSILDQLIATEQLRIALAFKAREQAFAENHSFDPYDLSPISTISNPVIDIFKESLQLLTIEDGHEAKYFHLKTLLTQSVDNLDKKDAANIFRILINYLINQMYKNEKKYGAEYFDLYTFGLRNDLVFENNYLKYVDFVNTTIVCTRLNKVEWTKNFIKKYAAHLYPEERDNAKTLAMAYIYFQESNYEKVTQIMYGYQSINPLLYYNPKFLLIWSYYELFEKDISYKRVLHAACSAIEKNIKRNKSLNANKTVTFLNFVSFIKKLIKYKDFNNSISQEELWELLESYSSIGGKKWLAKKVKNLE